MKDYCKEDNKKRRILRKLYRIITLNEIDFNLLNGTGFIGELWDEDLFKLCDFIMNENKKAERRGYKKCLEAINSKAQEDGE